MTTLTACVIVWLVVECFSQVLTIGRPREPRTPFEAVIAICTFAFIIYALAVA